MRSYVKRRGRPVPGSIPEALDIFRSEVRFYREIAPVIGVRVPACYRSEDTSDGTILVLEDLSSWQPGADPLAAARLLSGMHRSWAGQALLRWPWLRPVGVAAGLVADLFRQTWSVLADRGDLPADVLPALAVQGLLSMADTEPESAAATGWTSRLAAAAARISQ